MKINPGHGRCVSAAEQCKTFEFRHWVAVDLYLCCAVVHHCRGAPRIAQRTHSRAHTLVHIQYCSNLFPDLKARESIGAGKPDRQIEPEGTFRTLTEVA